MHWKRIIVITYNIHSQVDNVRDELASLIDHVFVTDAKLCCLFLYLVVRCVLVLCCRNIPLTDLIVKTISRKNHLLKIV